MKHTRWKVPGITAVSLTAVSGPASAQVQVISKDGKMIVTEMKPAS